MDYTGLVLAWVCVDVLIAHVACCRCEFEVEHQWFSGYSGDDRSGHQLSNTVVELSSGGVGGGRSVPPAGLGACQLSEDLTAQLSALLAADQVLAYEGADT